jgi:hypothetical protein
VQPTTVAGLVARSAVVKGLHIAVAGHLQIFGLLRGAGKPPALASH